MTLLDVPLLDVQGLTVEYAGAEPVRAVDDVNLTLRRGETIGIAGESGSGKSTLTTAIARLQRPPAETIAGKIIYGARDGSRIDLAAASPAQLRALRWESLSIVFQSAMNSLNPVMKLGAQFIDTLRLHRGLSRRDARERAVDLLVKVGIPAEKVRSYPHELSGGQRQRALIALALACDPDLVILDEPTTAVDVVMQRQILLEIKRLQDELGFAVLFITHDLSLLIELADRVAIMYAGRVVEIGTAQDIYRRPQHPYTIGLRDAFPPLHGPRQILKGMAGAPPKLRQLPTGCAFHPRCPQRFEECDQRVPVLPAGDHAAACLLLEGARG